MSRLAVNWIVSRVVFLGLDGAGKTSLVQKVSENLTTLRMPLVEPTTGFHVRTIDVAPNHRLEGWDIGGAAIIRQFWSQYLKSGTRGVVWVVDSSDASRMQESVDLLRMIYASQRCVHGLPILVLLNKSEIASVDVLKQAHSLFNKAARELHVKSFAVHACSVTNRQSIEDALRWLTRQYTTYDY